MRQSRRESVKNRLIESIFSPEPIVIKKLFIPQQQTPIITKEEKKVSMQRIPSMPSLTSLPSQHGILRQSRFEPERPASPMFSKPIRQPEVFDCGVSDLIDRKDHLMIG